jgi:hypothetical protein
MDILKNNVPEAAANTILLFVFSQMADIMKKQLNFIEKE